MAKKSKSSKEVQKIEIENSDVEECDNADETVDDVNTVEETSDADNIKVETFENASSFASSLIATICSKSANRSSKDTGQFTEDPPKPFKKGISCIKMPVLEFWATKL